jgi:methylaspartate ammonia-lyase
MVEARQKLKEFIKMIDMANVTTLKDILDKFNNFDKGADYRYDFLLSIIDGVEESIGEVFDRKPYRVKTALKMFKEIMHYYSIYKPYIVDKGYVESFIEFIDKVIEVLKKEDEYREIVEDVWIDLQEILKDMLSW